MSHASFDGGVHIRMKREHNLPLRAALLCSVLVLVE